MASRKGFSFVKRSELKPGKKYLNALILFLFLSFLDEATEHTISKESKSVNNNNKRKSSESNRKSSNK
jgi:hypothetical protein